MTESLSLFVPLLGRALLHFLWEGTVIALVAALLLQALRDARPQARYAVACAALLACALAPVFDILRQLAGDGTAGAVPAAGLRAATLAPVFGGATRVLAPAGGIDQVLPWVVAVWAAGACALSLRLAMGVWWVQRLRALPRAGAHAAWQARVDALARRFGLRRRVALRVVEGFVSPASVGWWRPVVLVPAALLARLPVELLEALVAHELAHIRRHDYLVNLLQGAVEALLFYHPATWWLSHRIRREREQIADRLAADVIGAPRTLARALSELSELAGRPASDGTLPSPALAAQGGHLMTRIEQLVRPDVRRSGGRIAFPLLGLVAACIALLAHAQAGQSIAAPADAPVPAAHAAPPAKDLQVRLAERPRGTTYALVRKGRDGITMAGEVRDAETVDALRHVMPGDFLWFRRGGQAYVIEDAAVIDRVDRAWAPTEALGKQMDALSARMEVHGRKMEALGARMKALSVKQQGDAETQAAARRMQSLGQQQQQLAERQARLAAEMVNADEARQARLQKEMDALSDQQDALGEQIDAASDRIEDAGGAQAQAQEAVSRQMEEAGKPMEEIGRQLDALGDQMDQLSARAERETLQQIDEAVKRGLAKPAPVRR